MVGRTRSSRARAAVAVVLGLLAVATLPAAIALARESRRVALLDAAWAIPPAFVLAVIALFLARRARAEARWRVGGGRARLAAFGSLLGLLGLCIALSGAVAVGFYALLVALQ